MALEALAQSVARWKAAVYSSARKQLIADVSLGQPTNDRSEASFIKSVLWAYVFWFEASQPTGRYIMNIVRNSSAEDHKAASRTFLDIQNLRTFHAHNLITTDKNDHYKYSQAKAWLTLNGGTEGNWEHCTDKLCSDLAIALDILCSHWKRVTASPEDADTAVKGLTEILEREWEPHSFDVVVEETAELLGLSDFDVVRYRKARLLEWQKITGFFVDRASAKAAVRRAILQEMTQTFGPPSS